MINKNYLAGFLDGEGCITIIKHIHKKDNKTYSEYQGVIVVANSNKKILREFKMRWGGNIYVGMELKPHHKIRYSWRLSSKSATKVCEDLVSKVFIKKRHMGILIELQSMKINKGKRSEEVIKRQDRLFFEIRKLNKRGIK